MSRPINADKVIEIIEAKQKELCPVGRYGRAYVYSSDREKWDAWDEIIDAIDAIPTEPLTLDRVAEILAEQFGDECACNLNGNDEWLPEVCKYQDTCPNPSDYLGCWMELLRHKYHLELNEKEAQTRA